jgi:hypothetical protein
MNSNGSVWMKNVASIVTIVNPKTISSHLRGFKGALSRVFS